MPDAPHIPDGKKKASTLDKFSDKKHDIGQIRTDAPEGTRFLVLRDNHSATMPFDVGRDDLLKSL
jgi:hypothetical protein